MDDQDGMRLCSSHATKTVLLTLRPTAEAAHELLVHLLFKGQCVAAKDISFYILLQLEEVK